MNSVTALSAPSLQAAARDARPNPADPHGPSPIALDARVAGSSNGNGPAGEKPFTPLVRQFLNYLKLEKHFSDYTVKSYGADLVQFGQFLAGEIGQPVGSQLTCRSSTCSGVSSCFPAEWAAGPICPARYWQN